jgi:hypothetical protein
MEFESGDKTLQTTERVVARIQTTVLVRVTPDEVEPFDVEDE